MKYAYGADLRVRAVAGELRSSAAVGVASESLVQWQPPVDDPTVPFVALETFGANPDILNLGVKFFLDENILTSV